MMINDNVALSKFRVAKKAHCHELES